MAQCLQDMLDPLGVGVIAEAQHLCMMMRGVEKQQFRDGKSSTMLGAFRKNKETRDEFFCLWCENRLALAAPGAQVRKQSKLTAPTIFYQVRHQDCITRIARGCVYSG